jgi:hypothetical protein
MGWRLSMEILGGWVTSGVPGGPHSEGGTPSGQPAGRRRYETSAAYKVDDFQLIAFGQVGFGPLIPWDDVAVQFYGDPVLLHAQVLDQPSQRDCSEGLFLAVDDYLHRIDSRK